MHDLEGVVHALLPDGHARLEGRGHELAVVAQHEEGLVADDDDQVARLGPLDVLGRHVDPPHQPALGPIEEEV